MRTLENYHTTSVSGLSRFHEEARKLIGVLALLGIFPLSAFADTKIADSPTTAGTGAAARTPVGVLEVTNGDATKATLVIKNGSSAAAANGATPALLLNNAGQLVLGAASPSSASAILDVKSTNKGVLLPRVALTSATDTVTIPSPATGLLVYNTGAGALTTAAYMFWDGATWRAVSSSSTVTPSIAALDCTTASINPAAFVAGVPYSGVMTVNYSGGNGGAYSGGTGVTSTGNTGLTAKLQGGQLSAGNGTAVFDLTGTPAQASPNNATFALSMLGKSCSAAVSGTTLGIGQSIVYQTTMTNAQATQVLPAPVTLSDIDPNLPSVDGLKIDLTGFSRSLYQPKIKNVSLSPITISYQTFATQVNQNATSLGVTLAAGASENVDVDNVVFWSNVAAEVETTNVNVQVSPGVYRWYEFKWWAMEMPPFVLTGGPKTIFLSITRKL